MAEKGKEGKPSLASLTLVVVLFGTLAVLVLLPLPIFNAVRDAEQLQLVAWLGHETDQWIMEQIFSLLETVNREVGHHWGFQRIKNLCEGIRGLGGEIALDDVAGTDLEERMIEVFRPRVLKANDRSGLDFISSLGTGAIVVAEHIESSEIATQAVKLGASELQGYWCDVLKEHEVPRILTPPGVAARNRQLQLAAA